MFLPPKIPGRALLHFRVFFFLAFRVPSALVKPLRKIWARCYLMISICIRTLGLDMGHYAEEPDPFRLRLSLLWCRHRRVRVRAGSGIVARIPRHTVPGRAEDRSRAGTLEVVGEAGLPLDTPGHSKCHSGLDGVLTSGWLADTIFFTLSSV